MKATDPKPIQPANIEAELAVLGAILLDNAALGKVLPILDEEHFYREAHRRIFVAMRGLHSENTPIDLLTLGDRMKKKGTLEDAGGESYLAALVDAVPTAAGVESHARLVKEPALGRQLADIGSEIKDAAQSEDLQEAIQQAGRTLEKLQQEAFGNGGKTFKLIRPADLPAVEVEFLVEGLIPKRMLTLLGGKDKLGKTPLSQEIVKAVLRGEPFLNEFETHQGPVIAFYLDDPWALTRKRFAHLGILGAPDFEVSDPDTVDLSSALTFLSEVEASAREKKAALIVLDALYLLLPGRKDGDKDAASMRPLMLALNKIAEKTGAAVLVVCHDTKSGGDVAGSYVLRAVSKTILRVTLPRGDHVIEGEPPQTNRRILNGESKLFRCRHELELSPVSGQPGCIDWAYLGESAEVRKTDTKEAVRQYLDSGGKGTVDEISEAIGGRRREDVRQALSGLGSWVVVSDRKTGKGRPAQVFAKAAPDGISVPAQEEAGTESRDGNSNPREPALLLASNEPIPANPDTEPPDGKSTSKTPVVTGSKQADGLSVPVSSPGSDENSLEDVDPWYLP